jgi:hypothetical protein
MYYSTTNGAGDSVTDHTNLRIAKAPIGGPAWEDIGGSGTASGTGNIVSSSFNTFSRFSLSNNTGGSNPLPIVLISFTAKPNGSNVDLNWVTATEINNDFFTIERSKDAKNFEFVANVQGAGNSATRIKYFSQDEKPYQGTSFYRLKQTDFDGKFEYSKIVAVNFLTSRYGAMINTNPIVDELTIEIPGNEELVNLEIINSVGAVVYQGKMNQKTTLQTSGLAAGMYLIKVGNDTNYEIKKLIKQ